MRLSVLRNLFLGATAILATSCSVDDGREDFVQNPTAYGIVGNASPSSGDLFVFADDNQIGESAFNYADVRGYYYFSTGERTLSLRNTEGDTLATKDITLNDGDFFSAFVVNTFDNIELVTYKDSLQRPAGTNGRLRFINLSPDAPEVTITGAGPAATSNLAFKEASDFVDVPSGSYTISVALSSDASQLTTLPINIQSGRIYTVYTRGFVNPPAGSNETFATEVLRNY